MNTPTNQLLDDDQSQQQNLIDVSYPSTSKWIIINSCIIGLVLSISIGIWAIFATLFLPSAHVPFIFKFFYWLISGWLILTGVSVVYLWRNINTMGDFQYIPTSENLEKVFIQKIKYWRLSGLNLAIGCFLIISFFTITTLNLRSYQSSTEPEVLPQVIQPEIQQGTFEDTPTLERSDINQSEKDSLR